MEVATQQTTGSLYEQTDVGVIPEGWAVRDLADVARVIDGDRGTHYPSAEEFSHSGYCLFLNAGNVTSEGFNFANCAFITQEKDALLRKGRLKRDDIVLTTRGTVGNFAHYNSTVIFDNIRINSGMVILRNESTSVDTEFLYASLRSHLVGSQIERFAFGSAQPQLTVQGIAKLKVLIPPLPEQLAIARVAKDADQLIDVSNKLITKKRDVKHAVMQKLLTGETRVPGFGGEWRTLNMSDHSLLKARIGWQGLTTAEYLKTGEYYLVTGTDLINGQVNWSSCSFVERSRYLQDPNIQLAERDVLLTKDGTIGKVAYIDTLPGPATLNSGVFVIRPRNQEYDPLFFYYILSSRIFEEFLGKLQAGSTIVHLYQKDFVDFTFRAPLVKEQSAVAEVLSDMDSEIAVLDQRREKILAVKQAVMQELLTGKTRLV